MVFWSSGCWQGCVVSVMVCELRGPLLIEKAGLLPGSAALALQGWWIFLYSCSIAKQAVFTLNPSKKGHNRWALGHCGDGPAGERLKENKPCCDSQHCLQGIEGRGVRVNLQPPVCQDLINNLWRSSLSLSVTCSVTFLSL